MTKLDWENPAKVPRKRSKPNDREPLSSGELTKLAPLEMGKRGEEIAERKIAAALRAARDALNSKRNLAISLFGELDVQHQQLLKKSKRRLILTELELENSNLSGLRLAISEFDAVIDYLETLLKKQAAIRKRTQVREVHRKAMRRGGRGATPDRN